MPTDYQVVCSLISELTSDELKRVLARIADELRNRRVLFDPVTTEQNTTTNAE